MELGLERAFLICLTTIEKQRRSTRMVIFSHPGPKSMKGLERKARKMRTNILSKPTNILIYTNIINRKAGAGW